MNPSSIDELGAEVKAPQREVRTVERSGPTFEEPWPEVDCERSRVKAATQGGMSATDKQRRLHQLRAAVLRAKVPRELALREAEGAAEFQPRLVHPELAIYKQATVERLAAR